MKLTPLEPILRENLLTLAHAYADARGRQRGRPLKIKTVSKYVYGDEPFFDNLAKGGGVNIIKYDEMVAWFAAHWPDDDEMPSIRNTLEPLPDAARRRRRRFRVISS